jgi:geranylgeranyl diphosphate synthase type I
MSHTRFNILLEEIGKRHKQVNHYLNTSKNRIQFENDHLQAAVYSYINAGGKSLRSAVMMFACGAVGGDEETTLPAAAAIELYHTFTLVHDDIIDRDDMRRGVQTVHTEFAQRGERELGYDTATAKHYGLAVAILAGDMQQGWAASLLPDLYTTYGVPADLALNLVHELFHRTQVALINGETTDIIQAATPVEQLTEDDVLEMLRQKTGVLYEFAGRAGAAIGLRESDIHHHTVEAVSTFTRECGTAFQIQDDILGITANKQKLGKAVGADIREGKRTIIVLHALKNMASKDRDVTLATLGNQQATEDEIQHVTRLLIDAGGVDHARALSEQYIHNAVSHLDSLPPSRYKELLITWADYIIHRDF